MATKTLYVHVSRIVNETIEVEIDLPDDADTDEMVDAALEEAVRAWYNMPGLCRRCTGYGQSFDREIGEGYEVDLVTRDREAENVLYASGSQWHRT